MMRKNQEQEELLEHSKFYKQISPFQNKKIYVYLKRKTKISHFMQRLYVPRVCSRWKVLRKIRHLQLWCASTRGCKQEEK